MSIEYVCQGAGNSDCVTQTMRHGGIVVAREREAEAVRRRSAAVFNFIHDGGSITRRIHITRHQIEFPDDEDLHDVLDSFL